MDQRDDDTVVVVDSGPGSLTQNVRTGRHELISDEPLGIGDDKGPTPHELLLAALGSCITMTIRMYADRKQWALERVAVAATHDRRPSDASDAEGTGRHQIDYIDVQLTLEGDLSAEQLERLHTIARRCPVHRTLTGDIRIAVSPKRP